MASLRRHDRAAPAAAAERRYATAVLRISRPLRAANDNAGPGAGRYWLLPLLAALAAIAATLWSVLG